MTLKPKEDMGESGSTMRRILLACMLLMTFQTFRCFPGMQYVQEACLILLFGSALLRTAEADKSQGPVPDYEQVRDEFPGQYPQLAFGPGPSKHLEEQQARFLIGC